MRRNFRHWLAGARGAATTEKLVVLLFAILLVGGGAMVFGPMLAKKYSFVAEMIGGEPTPTLADGGTYHEEGTNPIWYVLFTILTTIFFLGFVGPMLFPRARDTRARVLNGLADRFPVLSPLISTDARVDHGMDDLRHLADEVNAMAQKKKGDALEIKPSDFGQMASPVDATMDGGPVKLPPPPEDFGTSRSPAVNPASSGAATDPHQLILGSGDEDEATVSVEPHASGPDDDGIPFDAVSPEAKPQMRPDPRKHRYSVGQRRPGSTPQRDESTTVDIDTPQEQSPGVGGDRLVADILRQSGAFGAAAGDSDATIIRTSGQLDAVGDADPDAPTQLRDALSREDIRQSRQNRAVNPDATLPAEVRQPDDPDATTQNYQSFNKD